MEAERLSSRGHEVQIQKTTPTHIVPSLTATPVGSLPPFPEKSVDIAFDQDPFSPQTEELAAPLVALVPNEHAAFDVDTQVAQALAVSAPRRTTPHPAYTGASSAVQGNRDPALSPAQAQAQLHDYDASETENTLAPTHPETEQTPSWEEPVERASAELDEPFEAPGDYNPYVENPYEQNSESIPKPVAMPFVDPSDGVFDLEGTETMASARPGGESFASQGMSLKKPSAITQRTLRTALSSAAVVALITATAWVGKDYLPNADTIFAKLQSADATSEVTELDTPAGSDAPVGDTPFVTLTEATGSMSEPKFTNADAAKTTLENYASLDAAVAGKNPVAQLQKGLLLLQSGNATEAAKYIRLSANQNLPAAQYYLGNLYENGEGVVKDASQARRLTELAARAGHRIAMYDLAIYYIEGKGGVRADMGAAAKWFRKAAEFGMTDAQYNLAVLYERGTGVQLDKVEAYNWYSIAGSQGDQDAAARAEQLRATLAPVAVKRANSKIAAFSPAQFNEVTNGIFRDLPWNTKVSRSDPKVAKVQSLLIDLGFDAGVADGSMGPQTRKAIKEFERANALPETGTVDGELIEQLQSASQA